LRVFLTVAIPVLSAILWRMGGAQGYDKRWRRLGVPITFLVVSILLDNWFKGAVSAGVLIFATHLPITLIGNEERDNWWWIPILGQIHGAALAPFNWTVGVAVGALYSVLLLTSVYTNYKFKWEWFEYSAGALLGLGFMCVV